MKILALGATNSVNSINQQLAHYAASLVQGAEINLIDLNDYELPLFGIEKETELGQPELAKALFEQIGQADALVISFAEHNGSYTVAYKNIFDWMSRIDQKVFQSKPMVMLSTSPGPGGAVSVLQAASGSAPYFAGDVKGTFSLKSFFDNFDSTQDDKITDSVLLNELKAIMNQLTN